MPSVGVGGETHVRRDKCEDLLVANKTLRQKPEEPWTKRLNVLLRKGTLALGPELWMMVKCVQIVDGKNPSHPCHLCS